MDASTPAPLRWTRDLFGSYESSDGRFTIRRRTVVTSGLRGSRGSSHFVTFDLYDGDTKAEHGRRLRECKAAAENLRA
jgi:hypothetical protein